MTDDPIRRLGDEWSALNAELEALWQREGRPSGKRWAALAEPLWTRHEAVEVELSPLLLQWAESSGLGSWRDGSGHLGLVGWYGEPGSYARMAERMGLEGVSWQTVSRILSHRPGLQAEDSWREFVHAMPENEWQPWLTSYCASSPEGVATRDMLIRLRAELEDTR